MTIENYPIEKTIINYMYRRRIITVDSGEERKVSLYAFHFAHQEKLQQQSRNRDTETKAETETTERKERNRKRREKILHFFTIVFRYCFVA